MTIRDLLDRLNKEGLLLNIEEEFDPKFEVSAVLNILGKEKGSPAVLFNKVKGYEMTVCGNLLNGEKKIALALDTAPESLWEEYKKRLENPIAPVFVDQGPVQDVVLDEVDIPRTIPVLTYHEKDASPYITQGVTFLKDPETGYVSMGLHRLQVKSKDKLGLYISVASVTSARILERAEEMGVPVQVAVAMGVEPAILLACYSIGPKVKYDKLHMAGGLGTKPVELVAAKSCGIKVPSNAMFVIEGEIVPGERDIDGPFGEVLGYYISGEGYVINAKLITHQNNPIYTVAQPFSYDDHIDTMMKMQIEMQLRLMIPNLIAIGYHFSSCFLVISIKKRNPWEAKSALYTCLNMLTITKYVVVVDDDVDPENWEDVGFALAGRCQPEKDIILINDVLGFDLDPSLKDGFLTSKIGIDATKPLTDAEKFEKVTVPLNAMEKAKRVIQNFMTQAVGSYK